MAPKRKPLRAQPKQQLAVATKQSGQKRVQENVEKFAKRQKSERKVKEDESDDNCSDDSSSDDEENEEEDESPVTKELTEEYTFEFNDMKEDYSAGIKMILASLLISNPSLAYHFADKIVMQDTVGTVVACEGEIDVFAFASIMPSSLLQMDDFYKTLKIHFVPAISEPHFHKIAEFLHSEDPSLKNQLGFLVHGRFSNLPLQLIAEAHKNLLLDYQWALQQDLKNPSGDVDLNVLKLFHEMKYVLLVTAINSEGEIPQNQNVVGRSDVFFDNFEDECYFNAAVAAFAVKTTGFFKPKQCLIMLIPVDKLSSAVNEIVKLVA